MKYLNKFLSILLVCVMILNMGIMAYAAEGEPTFTMSVDKTEVNVGDKVTLTITLDQAISDVTQLTIKVKPTFNGGKLGENITISNKSTVYDFTDNTAKAAGNFAITKLDEEWTIPAGTVATVEFTANAAGTLAFEVKTCSVTETYFDENGDYTGEGYVSINKPGETLSVTVSEAPAPTGYSVYASADSDTTKDGKASVSFYASNPDTEVTTYNAYDLTLTYDMDKLTMEADEETGKPILGGAAASDNADVNVTGNQIHIAGVGENKTNATDPIVTLTFTMNTTGVAEVAIAEAKVDNKGQAIATDAPEATVYGGADSTPGFVLIKVPYNVEKPDYVEGPDSALPGEDYNFSYTDTDNYTYEDLIVTMGGQNVIPTDNGNGTYTIENVNGDIKITVTQTPNTYNVTVDSSSTASVTASTTATYGVDYKFTVSPADAAVTVTDASGKDMSYSIANGEFVILGKDISGDFTIKAMITEQPENTTKITFEGIVMDEIVGGLVQYAPNNMDFDFTLKIQENTEYKAMIGDYEIPVKAAEEERTEDNEEGETAEEATLTFTIPAEKLNGTPVTVTIQKTSTVLDGLTVEVSSYIQLDEATMFLVTAEAGDAVLAYGEAPMYWSEKYDAYSWLVISNEGMDAVKAAAQNAITVYTGTEEKTVAYDFDVNQTNGTVDINDAQLTYDMYTAEYSSFDQVTMDKFLEADVNGDKTVFTEDVAAIIYRILNPTQTENSQE